MKRIYGTSALLLLVIGLIALILPAAASTNQLECQDKNKDYSMEQRIFACTAMIHSESDKTNVELAHYYRGNAYSDKGDLDRAIEDYTQAIHLNHNKPDPHYFFNRGNAYRNKGDLDLSVADYDQVINLNPKWVNNAFDNRAVAYRLKGNYDRAVADCSQAIRLDPKDAFGHYNCGLAYSDQGNYDRAIAEYGETIRLNPKLAPFVYSYRGNAYQGKNDYDRAITDYDNAIRLDPKFAFAYLSRGIANLCTGALPKALADLDHASALNPKDGYAALWLDIVGRRSQVASRLPQAIAQIDMTKWPAPIIRLFLGQTTPAAVLAAADDPNPLKKEGRLCEVNLYNGELALQQGAREDATRLFRVAAECCPKDHPIEVSAANAELRALGTSP